MTAPFLSEKMRAGFAGTHVLYRKIDQRDSQRISAMLLPARSFFTMI